MTVNTIKPDYKSENEQLKIQIEHLKLYMTKTNIKQKIKRYTQLIWLKELDKWQKAELENLEQTIDYNIIWAYKYE